MAGFSKTSNNKAEKLPRLDTDLIAQILSFCDASDVLFLLQISPTFFKAPISHTLAARSSLSLSFLLKRVPNTTFQKKNIPKQQSAVLHLLKLLVHYRNLTHLECSNLRSLTGHGWLIKLKPVQLSTLDLSGCASLDPQVLCNFLKHCQTSLRHLSLQGCIRIGSSALDVIAERHIHLQSLTLGGCSQSIGNHNIRSIFRNMNDLRHLDLQALNNITDLSGEFMSLLPDSVESLNISSCKKLRLGGVEALGAIQAHLNHGATPNGWISAPASRHRPIRIVLDATGSPRIGLCRGILAYFSLGRRLREIHLSGAEQIEDWEVEALSVACAQTLTCFQMRASQIGNASMEALAANCQVLTECDVSACFRINDTGIIALCSSTHLLRVGENKKLRCGSSLKALKIASLPDLTDLAVAAISKLEALHVLDIHDCPKVTTSSLGKTILRLPHIIDVNAKGTADGYVSLASILRRHHSNMPLGLRFVNQRLLLKSAPPPCKKDACCSLRAHSQRLSSSIPMQTMVHCEDCKLLPAFGRGVCTSCASKCHSGHRTFVGSWTRFYCDCPFSASGDGSQCIAMFAD